MSHDTLPPRDCLFVILRFLKENDIIKIGNISKKWELSVVSRSDRLWKTKYERRIKDTVIDEKKVKKIEDRGKCFFYRYIELRKEEWRYRKENPPLPFFRQTPYEGYVVSTTILGDKKVGKTCLAITYANGGNSFPDDWVPSIFEYFEANVLWENRHLIFGVFDSSGDVESLSDFRLKTTTCYILCHDVTNPSSFENVKSKWIPKLKEYCPSVPVILCGLKTDLRDDKDKKKKDITIPSVDPVFPESLTQAERDYLYGSYECCSKYCFIKHVFRASISAAFDNLEKFEKKKKKKKDSGSCFVM